MLRCSGGSVRAVDDTSRSPTWISPSEGSRKPAISRSVVVLPQPDGPSRQTSCPWSIFKRDVIDHRKRAKSLGQAAQINGRQSPHSHSCSCTDQRPAWYASIRTKTGWERAVELETTSIRALRNCAGFHIVRDAVAMAAAWRIPSSQTSSADGFRLSLYPSYNDAGRAYAPTFSPRYSIAASVPPLPWGIFERVERRPR